jgi:HK97 family phage major capsid protein
MFGTVLNTNDALHRRAKLREQGTAIIDTAKKANRDLSASEQTAIDDLMGELKGINKQLDEHAQGAHGGGYEFESVFPSAHSVPVHFGGMPGGNSLRAALANATEEQREEVKALAGYMTGQRDISASADLRPSGDGGFLIPTFVNVILQRNYAAFRPVVENCRLFPTDTGAAEIFPVISDSESAQQVDAEGLTGADATVSGDAPPTSLTGPTLHAYKISSKPVFVPRETFTDSAIDLVSEVVGALIARITRYENLRYTQGTGTSQAEGFLYNCSNYEGFDTLDLDVALDLAYSVPPLYRPNGIYMASDTTIKYLRKLKTGIAGDKRQLWAFEDANATLGTPATLHGYRIIVNNDMADVHSDGTYNGGLNSPLAFGDFSRFVVRQAENNVPWLWNYAVPAKDGRAVILFRRSDSKLLVNTAIAKLNPSGS